MTGKVFINPTQLENDVLVNRNTFIKKNVWNAKTCLDISES